MPCYLAIDCGLTQIKAAVIDDTGRALSLSGATTPVRGTAIDVAALTENLYRVVGEALKQANVTVTQICAAGHGNGLYYITKDGRTAAVSSMATAPVCDDPQLIRLTGQSCWGGQPLQILRQIKNEQPNLYAQIDKIMFCKDFLVYLLSGKIGTDYSDASAGALLDVSSNDYSSQILQIHGLTDAFDTLPKLHRSYESYATVNATAARLTGLAEGTPICAGMFDVNACILGAGDYTDSYQLIAGTWGINAVITGQPVICPTVTQSCLFLSPEQHMLIDSAPVSCVNLEWLMSHIFPHLTYDQANALVAQSPIDPQLFYLPYLYTPMDMPQARAGFIGLDRKHGPGDMIRAVFEGIAFEHRRRVDKFRAAGIERPRVVLSGGAAKSEIWCQMFADMLRVPVEQTAQAQAGLLGCAITCAVAHGDYPNYAQAVSRMTEDRRVFIPGDDLYTEKYNQFLKEITSWITK